MLADITVGALVLWMICLLLAAGLAWSRYEKKRVRDNYLRELMAMDPTRREKLLQRLSPKLETEMRQLLMERYRGG